MPKLQGFAGLAVDRKAIVGGQKSDSRWTEKR